jgi:hypothetical protein
MTGWPGWLAAERNGADCDGPGAGWDPLWARELDDAVRLGDLAARMTRVAARLAIAVRNCDQQAIGRLIGTLTPPRNCCKKQSPPLSEDVKALLVVMAGMVAGSGATVDELLAWVAWDEHGQPLPACDPEPVAHVTPIICGEAGEGRRAA